jgi:hypothetical protein
MGGKAQGYSYIIPPKAKVINIATRLRNIVVEVVSMLWKVREWQR